jgi:magnesium transporter
MKKEIIISLENGLQWIDLEDPTPEELFALSNQHGFSGLNVQNCLEPEHLPKTELDQSCALLIFRAYDVTAPSDGDTIQALTAKLAMLVKKDLLITIHRRSQPYIDKVKSSCRVKKEINLSSVLGELLVELALTYEEPINHALKELDRFEMGIFEKRQTQAPLADGYYLKRRAYVFKRLFRLSLDSLKDLRDDNFVLMSANSLQKVSAHFEDHYFYADELHENSTALINLHLTMASQRTNEIMRTLTVLSVFFLPLNLVAGIYGMNFVHMPELSWYWGYPMALLLMLCIASGILIWTRRKRWLS